MEDRLNVSDTGNNTEPTLKELKSTFELIGFERTIFFVLGRVEKDGKEIDNFIKNKINVSTVTGIIACFITRFFDPNMRSENSKTVSVSGSRWIIAGKEDSKLEFLIDVQFGNLANKCILHPSNYENLHSLLKKSEYETNDEDNKVITNRELLKVFKNYEKTLFKDEEIWKMMHIIATSKDTEKEKDEDWYLVCISDIFNSDETESNFIYPIEKFSKDLENFENSYVSWTFVKGYQLSKFTLGVTLFVTLLNKDLNKDDKNEHNIGGTTMLSTLRPFYAIRLSDGEVLPMTKYITVTNQNHYLNTFQI